MKSAPFHNGFGMMTVQGTRKPVWRAFELLMNAGTERLPVKGFVSPADGNSTVSVLATMGGSPAHTRTRSPAQAQATAGLGLQLFVANWHRLGDVERFKCDTTTKQCVADKDGPFTDDALCNANCAGRDMSGGVTDAPSLAQQVGDCPAAMVNITLMHAAGASLPPAATAFRIDDTHANPQKEWMALGSPTYINKTTIAALDEASKLVAEQVTLTKLSATETAISFKMPPYSAMHISL